jgi:hypothetical protein
MDYARTDYAAGSIGWIVYLLVIVTSGGLTAQILLHDGSVYGVLLHTRWVDRQSSPLCGPILTAFAAETRHLSRRIIGGAWEVRNSQM